MRMPEQRKAPPDSKLIRSRKEKSRESAVDQTVAQMG
jgi:hypothetical protein